MPSENASNWPPSVLRIIFLNAVFACGGRPSLTDAPINVSQACKPWRQVAISDGQLWSHLRLPWVGSPDDGVEKNCWLLQHWLQRSGDSTLYYDVNYTTAYSPDAHKLLFQQQHRWGRVGLSVKAPQTDTTASYPYHHRQRIYFNSLSRATFLQIKHLSSLFDPQMSINRMLLFALINPLTPQQVLFEFPPISNPAQAIAPRLTHLVIENLSTPECDAIPTCLSLLHKGSTELYGGWFS
jgi:hypothetical protein